MTLNLSMPEAQPELKPRITVFGVGGAGGNAVNNMITQKLDGCEFVVANTDAQALAQSSASNRIQMGARVTEGLGAGARPSVGASAAEESIDEIVDHLAGSHMAFITAGMGGGTGTGAAPIIAQAARELGVLTVGVVTKPFQFEGAKRMRQADEGIEALQRVVDTLIIIPNQNLFRLANEKTTFTEAFSLADDVLYQGVKGVTDLMVRPGLINLDFADVRAVMNEMGKAMMGTGEADGENRALHAAEKAIANPLLDEISLKGARGVLINITGGYDLTLFELDEAANRIREEVDPEANIIVGSTLDTDMEGQMRVSVVATGIDLLEAAATPPVSHHAVRAVPVAPQLAEAPQEPAAEPLADPEVERVQHEGFRPSVYSAEPQVEAYQDEDDVPPPAFQPAPMTDEAPQPVAEPSSPTYDYQASHPAPSPTPPSRGVSDNPFSSSAPRPPVAAGQPTPEALARLRAAIQNENASSRKAEAAQRKAETETAPRRGFGINTLINRMTGQSDDNQAPVQRPPATGYNAGAPTQGVRRDLQSSYDSGAVDPEQERIEIPAFLRRQAN